MSTIIELTWNTLGSTNEKAARYVANFTGAPTFEFPLNRTQQYADDPVKPNWLMIDNSANADNVTISYEGSLSFTVPANGSVSYKLPTGLKAVTATAAAGSSIFQFTENRYSDDVSSGFGSSGDGGGSVDVAAIAAFAADPATGWIYCNGQAISRTDYSALFAKIGIAYGGGDGASTFNVPDLRGRTLAGIDDGASRLTSTYFGTSPVLGANGGAESHTLSVAEIPAHTHSFSRRGGPATGVNGTVNDNRANAAPDGVTDNGTGGGGAHKNVQPTALIKWYIKT